MIRIYYWHPRYTKDWFGCVHLYRFGFVTGMQSPLNDLSYQEPHIDKNFLAGYVQGQPHHNQWKLKQLLKGK